MLSKQPQMRPTLMELRHHPWVLSSAVFQNVHLEKRRSVVLQPLSPVAGLDAISKTPTLPYGKAKKPRQGSFSDNSDQLSSHSDGSFHLDDNALQDYPEFSLKKPRAVSLGASKLQEEEINKVSEAIATEKMGEFLL